MTSSTLQPRHHLLLSTLLTQLFKKYHILVFPICKNLLWSLVLNELFSYSLRLYATQEGVQRLATALRALLTHRSWRFHPQMDLSSVLELCLALYSPLNYTDNKLERCCDGAFAARFGSHRRVSFFAVPIQQPSRRTIFGSEPTLHSEWNKYGRQQ